MRSILKLFLDHKCINEMSSYTPIVRNSWSKDKILKYLKKLPSSTGDYRFYKVLNSYKDFDEFKNNLYYHGSTGYIDGGLKPSIIFPKNWNAETDGGGGYGTRYWSVSVSKSKVVASNFSGNKDGLSIYPVLIKPDAHIITMDLKDSEELEEHIEDLWNKGVDAVYIGGGEQELCIINPSCSVMGAGEYQRVFNIKVKNPTDEELMAIWNSRNQKLTDHLEKDKARLAAKAAEKRKNEEEYKLLADKLVAAIEEYKTNDTKTYHPLIKLYHDLYSVGIKVIKHTELLHYKNLIINSIKTDWDKSTVRSQL